MVSQLSFLLLKDQQRLQVNLFAPFMSRINKIPRNWLRKGWTSKSLQQIFLQGELYFPLCNFPTIKTVASHRTETKRAKNAFLVHFSWLILCFFCSSRVDCSSKIASFPTAAAAARAFSQVLILFNVKTEKSNFTPAIVGDFLLRCSSFRSLLAFLLVYEKPFFRNVI